MQEISVFVGTGLDESGLSKSLAANTSNPRSAERSLLHEVAQALMASRRDSRVQVQAVKLLEVRHDQQYPSVVDVDFMINWDLYHGCEERNESDDEYASEGATYTADGYLIFRVPEPHRPPSDC
jgi:hypothetical protein